MNTHQVLVFPKSAQVWRIQQVLNQPSTSKTGALFSELHNFLQIFSEEQLYQVFVESYQQSPQLLLKRYYKTRPIVPLTEYQEGHKGYVMHFFQSLTSQQRCILFRHLASNLSE